MFEAKSMSDFMDGDIDKVECLTSKPIAYFPGFSRVELDITCNVGPIHVVWKIGLGERPAAAVQRRKGNVQRVVLAWLVGRRECEIRRSGPSVQGSFNGGLCFGQREIRCSVGDVIRQIRTSLPWPVPSDAGSQQLARF